jgi:hypothetical protein
MKADYRMLLPFAIGDAEISLTNVVETLPEWDGDTTWAKGDQVRVDANHHAYESSIDGNTGKDPTDPENIDSWIDLGATNPWAMFDDIIGTTTDNWELIDVTLAIPDRVSSITLLNIAAVEVQVIVTDALEGEVYNETFDMVSYDNVADYYDYFFAPIVRKDEVYIESLPLYSNAEIQLLIRNPGQLAKCGNAVFGDERAIGETQMGARLGQIDYSVKEFNEDWGGSRIVERPYRSTAQWEIKVPISDKAELRRLLTERRAKPTVFHSPSSTIYGFPRDWEFVDDEHEHTTLSLSLESLT